MRQIILKNCYQIDPKQKDFKESYKKGINLIYPTSNLDNFLKKNIYDLDVIWCVGSNINMISGLLENDDYTDLVTYFKKPLNEIFIDFDDNNIDSYRFLGMDNKKFNYIYNKYSEDKISYYELEKILNVKMKDDNIYGAYVDIIKPEEIIKINIEAEYKGKNKMIEFKKRIY